MWIDCLFFHKKENGTTFVISRMMILQQERRSPSHSGISAFSNYHTIKHIRIQLSLWFLRFQFPLKSENRIRFAQIKSEFTTAFFI